MRHISGKKPGYFVFFITFFVGVSGLCCACFGHGLFRFCFVGVWCCKTCIAGMLFMLIFISCFYW